jgi:hypothetical protein
MFLRTGRGKPTSVEILELGAADLAGALTQDRPAVP